MLMNALCNDMIASDPEVSKIQNVISQGCHSFSLVSKVTVLTVNCLHTLVYIALDLWIIFSTTDHLPTSQCSNYLGGEAKHSVADKGTDIE